MIGKYYSCRKGPRYIEFTTAEEIARFFGLSASEILTCIRNGSTIRGWKIAYESDDGKADKHVEHRYTKRMKSVPIPEYSEHWRSIALYVFDIERDGKHYEAMKLEDMASFVGVSKNTIRLKLDEPVHLQGCTITKRENPYRRKLTGLPEKTKLKSQNQIRIGDKRQKIVDFIAENTISDSKILAKQIKKSTKTRFHFFTENDKMCSIALPIKELSEATGIPATVLKSRFDYGTKYKGWKIKRICLENGKVECNEHLKKQERKQQQHWTYTIKKGEEEKTFANINEIALFLGTKTWNVDRCFHYYKPCEGWRISRKPYKTSKNKN